MFTVLSAAKWLKPNQNAFAIKNVKDTAAAARHWEYCQRHVPNTADKLRKHDINEYNQSLQV